MNHKPRQATHLCSDLQSVQTMTVGQQGVVDSIRSHQVLDPEYRVNLIHVTVSEI